MTYLRRPPVRRGYIEFQKIHGTGRGAKCAVCNRPDESGNPLQAAHLINALNGVRYFALTPDFLDDPERLVWAHRRDCNRRVELGFGQTMEHLWQHGVREVPGFLPKTVRSAWRTFATQSRRNRGKAGRSGSRH